MTDETQATVETDGNDTAAVLAAASGEKTYLPDKDAPEPEPVAETTDEPGDDAPETPVAEPAEKPKRKQTPDERIAEITRQKYEMAREKDRDIEFWKAKALQDTAKPAEPAQAAQQHDAPAEDQEPDPSYYEHGELDVNFIRDHAAFHALRTYRQETARDKAIAERQRLEADFKERVKTVAERNPDFDEVVGENYANVAKLVTPIMGVALTNSQEGPELAYHLAKNPAEARRIAALPDYAQAMELGKLAARLATPAKPATKTATDAPEPPPMARGAGGQFKVSADTDDFAAFERQHMPGR